MSISSNFDHGNTILRSLKCHNWADAAPALLKVMEEMEQVAKLRLNGGDKA
jgi:hypothetical protein